MTDTSSAAAVGQAAVASFGDGLRTLRARTEAAEAAMASATATVTSPDGAVTVTVNSAGVLVALQFGGASDSMPRDSLAQLVLSTARDGAGKALAEAERRLAEVVGADDPAVGMLHRRVEESESAGAVPQAAAPDDDDPVYTRG